eukprot:4421955-Alexandrium_andersonii.AAC.1
MSASLVGSEMCIRDRGSEATGSREQSVGKALVLNCERHAQVKLTPWGKKCAECPGRLVFRR